MAIKKFVAISYCFAFLFVYFFSIAYASLSTIVNKSYNTNLPQTQMMNNTTMAISSFSSWSGTLSMVGIIALIISLFFILNSIRAMSSAIT